MILKLKGIILLVKVKYILIYTNGKMAIKSVKAIYGVLFPED